MAILLRILELDDQRRHDLVLDAVVQVSFQAPALVVASEVDRARAGRNATGSTLLGAASTDRSWRRSARSCLTSLTNSRFRAVARGIDRSTLSAPR